MTYTAWQTELINWTPKEDGNLDINKRRPIALLEVLRKMHLGVKKQQQYDIWIKNKLINPDNYAFLKGKSTAMPILITKAVLEDSKFTGKEVHTLQVDLLRRAYDMVPYHIKEMSLRRMGVPEEGISLWCAYDPTSVKWRLSLLGATRNNTSLSCGAFAQGARCGGILHGLRHTDVLDVKLHRPQL